ncbi:NAD(P)H-hydrate dehydratase [Nocardioides dongxiaopingii]|uniref:NAD(P)H-hydrate dehydratase n=1 Tax=Nocardioides sp. S-1144 TaxID=2582905 RepID=UPI00110F4C4E|nr:NAD(P)H-hydrate dehydratase [Nocardioides sp. S-1144]QCW49345.1 NAD(P)H-hydrate dehydratase [Nocardioides sp. S-1144]
MPEPEVVTPELLRGWPLPGPGASKKSRGQAVVIGGAARTPGGVVLGGLAALRVGAGHLQLALADSAAPAVAATFPEAGVLGLEETAGGGVRGRAAAEACSQMVAGADAVLVGPGLDDPEEAQALVEGILDVVPDDAVLVLDAFALGVLAAVEDRVRERGDRVVLTPNADELARLLERDCEPVLDDVVEAAERYCCCVTAQGLVADGQGRSWRVPLGHPGLATAGSGDVLAGSVVGLLARGATPAQGACWGTYLHAMAGERLASAVGEVGFLARELVDQLPAIVSELG